jgi:hypothetical protein
MIQDNLVIEILVYVIPYPASRKPEMTMASAICMINVSFTPHAKVFQLLHPFFLFEISLYVTPTD